MFSLYRLKNRLIARWATRFPGLAERLTRPFITRTMANIPWTEPAKPLAVSRVALVTTAGVHPKDQAPFDMLDRDGDPSYRRIDRSQPLGELIITHDYYDHADADRDINIVFPIQRLAEFESEGLIGQLARFHYGFMGHITGRHVDTLVGQSAPEVARRLKEDLVDVALLTPG